MSGTRVGSLAFGGIVVLSLLRITGAQPTLSITVPENGKSMPVEIPARVEATLSGGDAERVAFFAGDTPLGTDTQAPYSVLWTQSSEGDYALSATAVLDNGTTVSSPTVLAKRKVLSIAPGVAWESVHTRSEGYSLLFKVLDGALYHGSDQLSSDPGLFRSGDQGEAWTRIWKNGGASVFGMACNDEYCFLATSSGVYRSLGNDEDWEKTSSSLSGGSSPLGLITIGDTVVACSQDGKIKHSADNGATWTNAHNSFSDDDLYGSLGMMLEIVRHNDYLFATSSYKGVARSGDFGQTWEPGRGDLPVRDAPKMIIGTDLAATSSMIFVVADYKVYGSANNGENWSLMLDESTNEIFAWGDELLAVGSGGIRLLKSASEDWITITQNVELPERVSQASLAVDGEYIYLAIESNGPGTPTLWRRPLESSSAAIPGATATQSGIKQGRSPAVYDLRGRRVSDSDHFGRIGTERVHGLYLINTEKEGIRRTLR